MSAVDDVRQLLPDLVAPYLRALDVRLIALEQKLDAVEKKLDNRIDMLDKSLTEKIGLTRDAILAEMRAMSALAEANLAKLTYTLDTDRRLSKIESERSAEQKESSHPRIA